MPRYALYYAPRRDEAIARFAAGWLGRDPEGDTALPQPSVSGMSQERVAAITAEPRRYGFHGTLKAPFALVSSASVDDLLKRAEQFAARRRIVELQGLSLTAIGGFLALVPVPDAALGTLAADCVRDFDDLRAAPDPSDLARRRQGGLSLRQESLLVRWGYPYVLDEFRFHLTLTAPLESTEREIAWRALAPLVAPFTARVHPIRDLAVFVQDSRDQPFRVLARFPFGGAMRA